MKYRRLRNFGQLHTAKVPAQVQLGAVTWLAGQLGVVNFPRYMAHLLAEDRRWKEFHFSEADKRGISHKEFIEWVQKGISGYMASVEVCGQEKSEEIYSNFTEKQGLLCWESFFPTAADFAQYADPWEALRQYFLEYFRVNHSEGVFNFEVVRDTNSELRFKVTDCAWHALFSEAGCPNLAHIGAQVDIIFLPRLLGEMGGDFQREHWICRGDTTCDWHFLQHKT